MIDTTFPAGLAVLLALFAGTVSAAASEAEVVITVTGAVAGTRAPAKVFGQVFADAASFKARDKAVLRFAIEPSGGVFRTRILLPPGRYVLAMFQDTKGTGKLETNMFGIPAVPYGFSNNARGTMGPPSFEDAAFTVGAAASALGVQLR